MDRTQTDKLYGISEGRKDGQRDRRTDKQADRQCSVRKEGRTDRQIIYLVVLIEGLIHNSKV